MMRLLNQSCGFSSESTDPVPLIPEGIENGVQLVCDDTRTGLLELLRQESGELDRMVIHWFDGTTDDPADLAGLEPCSASKNYLVLPGFEHPEHCTPVILCVEDCTFFTVHDGTKITMSQIGSNPSTNQTEERPFELKLCNDGTDFPMDSAAILARLEAAGATYPSGLPVTAADSYLHALDVSLGGIGTEGLDGAGVLKAATSCQGKVVDVETTSERDLDPGGQSNVMNVEPGNDIPDQSVEPELNAVVLICGRVSQRIDKSGVVIPKA